MTSNFSEKHFGDSKYINSLKKKEKKNIDFFLENKKENNLYPHLNDNKFNKIIFLKKEFNDNKYKKKDKSNYKKKNLIKLSNDLCKKKEFELDPHQLFVKNFISINTPYNGLLLYHGLGTGKTCSAITICEEMRKYYNLMGQNNKIKIICSKSLQENFKMQLFNPEKLENINGYWNIKSCVGNSLIKEVNPINIRNLSKEKVTKYIQNIIKKNYNFYGYIEFKNRMFDIIKKDINPKDSAKTREKKEIYNIKKYFSNTTIVIDEIHNLRVIRKSKQLNLNFKGNKKKINEQKKIDKESSLYIKKLVTYAINTKLLILSATPMFNKKEEIVWLLNLLNLNDGRYPIENNDIFNDDNELTEEGRELLIHKSRGYITNIKGNNPFTFPHKIFPNMNNNKYSLYTKFKQGWTYPTKQINNMNIIVPKNKEDINYDLILLKISRNQNIAYNNYLKKLFQNNKSRFNSKKIDINLLGTTRQILNIVYPVSKNEYLFGIKGIDAILDKKQSNNRMSYIYKKGVEHIFSYKNIKNYSSKIKNILDNIKYSQGIILIYSQYIEGGCLPMALALEEVGFEPYSSEKNNITGRKLFSKEAKVKWKLENNKTPKYVMITGRKSLTGSEKQIKNIMNIITDKNNKNGDEIKVVIISSKGSEGLDFKNIRQVHILEPWFNFNRLEQTIGRAVRKLSHCFLPYEKRNVEIFMYASLLLDDKKKESADMYLYRLSKKKSKEIGEINRILKINAVDCLLNKNANIHKNSKIEQVLSSNYYKKKKEIIYNTKNIDYSEDCDYMSCDYKCLPDENIDETNINNKTYNLIHINNSKNSILKRIKMFFKEKYVYNKNELILLLQGNNNSFSKEEIYFVLNNLIEEKTILFDMTDTQGYLINIEDDYYFQPLYIDNKNTSYYNRSNPILKKTKKVSFKLPKTNVKPEKKKRIINPNIKDVNKLKINKHINLDILFSHLITDFNMLIKEQNQQKKDWISIASRVLNNVFSNEKINKKNQKIYYYLTLQHPLYLLTLRKKIYLLNHYKSYKPSINNTSSWKIVREAIEMFFNQFILKIGNNKICILNDNETKIIKKIVDGNYANIINYHNIFILKKGKNEWKITDEYDDINNEIETEYFKKHNLDFRNLNQIFGFFRPSLKTKEFTFYYKTKDDKKKYDPMHQTIPKNELINLFNEIDDKYLPANKKRGKIIIKKNKKIIKYSSLELVVELEIKLLYLNYKEKKKYFLNPYEDYIFYKKF